MALLLRTCNRSKLNFLRSSIPCKIRAKLATFILSSVVTFYSYIFCNYRQTVNIRHKLCVFSVKLTLSFGQIYNPLLSSNEMPIITPLIHNSGARIGILIKNNAV